MNHSGIISTSRGQHGIQNVRVCVGMCVWERGLPEFWAGSTPCLPHCSPIFLCPPSCPRRISPRKLNLLSPPAVAPVSLHHSHHRHLPCSGWPKAPINFSPSLFSNQQSSQVGGTSRWAPGKTLFFFFPPPHLHSRCDLILPSVLPPLFCLLLRRAPLHHPFCCVPASLSNISRCVLVMMDGESVTVKPTSHPSHTLQQHS